MSDLLRKAWRPLLTLLVALALFLALYFTFYPGDYDAPPTARIPFEEISAPSSNIDSFVELPPGQEGLLLVDGIHRNDFQPGEIGALLSRVADRGYEVEFLGGGDRFGFPSIGGIQREFLLDEALRRADSLAVVLPTVPYGSREVDLVDRFVQKGGRLLLMADPTRAHEINSLAGRFGVAFQPDYLYNTREYDINFQNIFIRDFRPDQVTRGLHQIVLYTAGSIRSSGTGLAVTDGNTRSALIERIEPFYPMVVAGEGRVLAISDLTFMIPPQDSILDNDRLVANMADYLTTSTREFELGDFPHFLKSGVDILLRGPELFDTGTSLRNALSEFQIESAIRGVEDLSRDTVFLGLYAEADDLAQYLDVAGIQVDGALRTPFTPEMATSRAAIILLHRTENRNVMVILGESGLALTDMVNRLASGIFRNGLVSEFLGVYRTF